jgi:hypothetical protein
MNEFPYKDFTTVQLDLTLRIKKICQFNRKSAFGQYGRSKKKAGLACLFLLTPNNAR